MRHNPAKNNASSSKFNLSIKSKKWPRRINAFHPSNQFRQLLSYDFISRLTATSRYFHMNHISFGNKFQAVYLLSFINVCLEMLGKVLRLINEMFINYAMWRCLMGDIGLVNTFLRLWLQIFYNTRCIRVLVTSLLL